MLLASVCLRLFNTNLTGLRFHLNQKKHKKILSQYLVRMVYMTVYMLSGADLRGGSDGSVEPPKLNVKTYNKRVVKKKREPTT